MGSPSQVTQIGLLDWAIAEGLSVIPLDVNKKPLIPRWKHLQERLPNADEVASWKKLGPSAWAFITGAISRRVTLDFDGEAGTATMKKLGITPHRQSPSGGYHADFIHPGWRVPTLNSKSKIELGLRWAGLDIRADGGYCAFLGQSGQRKESYKWLSESKPYDLDILPLDLRDFLGLLRAPSTAPSPQRQSPNVNQNEKASNARVSVERLISQALQSGKGRNDAGFSLAGQLRDNRYEKAEAAAAMRDYRSRAGELNRKGQREAYTEAEMLKSLDQAYSRAARDPWGSNGSRHSHRPPASENVSENSQKPSPAAEVISENVPPEPAPHPAIEEIEQANPNWEKRLILTANGTPKALLANAIKALKYAPEFHGVLAFDEFRLDTVTLKSPPWKGGAGGKTWTDHEDRLTADWMQNHGICVNVDVAAQAALVVAKDRSFHPVRSYLDSLKWDGTKRIDSWLSLYLGVETNDYVQGVGARWLISAVARIYNPGVKADCSLILEGKQGLGKSESLKILASEPWFTDELADVGSKDAAMQTQGIWIIEIAEMKSMRGVDANRIKAFMSRSTDRFRPPYGRRLVQSPRQCIFAITVNPPTRLSDETGARRFWPVACTVARRSDLRRDRDQLWAEAVHAHLVLKRPHWIDSDELTQLAEQEQAARYEADAWDAPIEAYLSKVDDTSIGEILEHGLNKKPADWHHQDNTRVGKYLVSRGWEQYRTGLKDGRVRRYRSPQLVLGI